MVFSIAWTPDLDGSTRLSGEKAVEVRMVSDYVCPTGSFYF